MDDLTAVGIGTKCDDHSLRYVGWGCWRTSWTYLGGTVSRDVSFKVAHDFAYSHGLPEPEPSSPECLEDAQDMGLLL